MAVDVAQLLSFTVKNNASDLHLSGGVPPMIRVDGDIKRINMPALTHKDVNSTPTTRTAARLQSFASSRRKS
jgi:twitching motility protein PilT